MLPSRTLLVTAIVLLCLSLQVMYAKSLQKLFRRGSVTTAFGKRVFPSGFPRDRSSLAGYPLLSSAQSNRNSLSSLFSSNSWEGEGNFDKESSPTKILYLFVPFEEKDQVKEKGAMWEPTRKLWYIEENRVDSTFDQWRQRTLLNVPFDQKDEVKKLGGKWDGAEKKWWFMGSIDNNPQFSKWDVAKVVMSQPENRPESMPEELELKTTKTWAAAVRGTSGSVETPTKSASANDDASMGTLIDQSSADNSNSNSGSSESNSRGTFVFLDIETNGLIPRENFPSYNQYPDISDTVKYDECRIVQFSFLVCAADDLSKVLNTGNYTIKSDGFPIDNSNFHGITLEMSMSEGVAFSDMVGEISSYFAEASCLFAHNTDFDLNVLKSELYRYGLTTTLTAVEEAPLFCTMKETQDLVGVRDKADRIKYPKLVELYTFATSKAPEDMVNAHNSLHDVIHMHESIKALVDKGVLNFQPPAE